MSEQQEAIVVATKAKKVSSVKKPKSSHPPTAVMVDAAIGSLKERGGSSVLAIKKYVASTYKVDIEKLAPFIKKYIKGAVVKGDLIQTKGKGASGSFKLSSKKAPAKKVAAKPMISKKPEKKKTRTVAKKPTATKKAKVVVAKVKVTASKKVAASPKKATKKPAAKKVSAKK